MIAYFDGDVRQAVLEDNVDGEKRILIHICNDKGGWGAGFVLALSKKWKQPEKLYRECFKLGLANKLGNIQVCQVDDFYIINMIAQEGYATRKNPIPLRYDALKICLQKVADFAQSMEDSPSIYCPKIGSGLAGGNWNIISKMLEELNLPVYVYMI